MMDLAFPNGTMDPLGDSGPKCLTTNRFPSLLVYHLYHQWFAAPTPHTKPFLPALPLLLSTTTYYYLPPPSSPGGSLNFDLETTRLWQPGNNLQRSHSNHVVQNPNVSCERNSLAHLLPARTHHTRPLASILRSWYLEYGDKLGIM